MIRHADCATCGLRGTLGALLLSVILRHARLGLRHPWPCESRLHRSGHGLRDRSKRRLALADALSHLRVRAMPLQAALP